MACNFPPNARFVPSCGDRRAVITKNVSLPENLFWYQGTPLRYQLSVYLPTDNPTAVISIDEVFIDNGNANGIMVLTPGWTLAANGPNHYTLATNAASAAGFYTVELEVDVKDAAQGVITNSAATILPWAGVSNTVTTRMGVTLQNTIPDLAVGVPVNFQYDVQNGSGVYTVSLQEGDLPNGLTMDSTGLVTGTPTEPGNLTYILHVVDANGSEVILTEEVAVSFKEAQALDCLCPTTLTLTTITLT